MGPPLAKAEHELPSFGRAAITFTAGAAIVAGFAAFLIASLVENKSGWFQLWKVIGAGEVAAWRLKFVALPLAILTLFAGARIVRSIKLNPSRFTGLRLARIGFASVVAVIVVMATLIGVTVPERLRQRQYALEAATKARGYTLHRAFLEYRELHGTYPTDPDKFVEALRTLPDSDGTIADALRFVDPNGYEASAQLAAAPKKKSLIPRGTALRDVNTVTSPEPAGLSFTTYSLRLPSEHRLLGSDEDFILQDGVIKKASEVAATSSTILRTRTP